MPRPQRPEYARSVADNLRPGGYYHLFAFDWVGDSNLGPTHSDRGLGEEEVHSLLRPPFPCLPSGAASLTSNRVDGICCAGKQPNQPRERPQSDQNSMKENTRSTQSGSSTVLVVDDDAQIVRLIRSYLEQAGYKVESAADGEAALHVVRALRPDLVILDLGLPVKDGLDVHAPSAAMRNLPTPPS